MKRRIGSIQMKKYFKMTKWYICWHHIHQHYKQIPLNSSKIVKDSLQTDTTKFEQDFIGPLFIDTALDKTHYRLKDTTGLLLDGPYHMNRIKKGSACTLQGIVDTFDGYQKALKNTLLNRLAIETLDNKIQEVTLKDGSKKLNYLPGTIVDYTSIYS